MPVRGFLTFDAPGLPDKQAVDAAVRRLPGATSIRWHSEQEFKRNEAGAEHP